MNQSNNHTTGDSMKNRPPWGDIRKSVILVLVFTWLVGFFYNYEKIDAKAFYVLFCLVALYAMDILFSIILSAKASELFKSFMFQTFIPISALALVSFLAFNGSINSSTTLSLFGLSLGYTTYVVGKSLKKESGEGEGD